MAASLSVRVTRSINGAGFVPPKRLAGSHGLGKRRVSCDTNFVELISTNECLQKMIGGKNLLHCIRMWMIKVGELCVAFIYKKC